MTRIPLVVAAAAAAVLITAFSETPGLTVPAGTVPTSEQLVKESIVSDMFEIQAGKLAQSKARKRKVKELGATLVEDHRTTCRQLKSLLNSGKVRARAPDSLDSFHRSMLEKLKTFDGDEFDGQFLSDTITDHKNDISLYERYARNGDNAELRRFAVIYLPTLQYDLNMARSASGEY